jgi:Zn-dependent protease with chaperone function
MRILSVLAAAVALCGCANVAVQDDPFDVVAADVMQAAKQVCLHRQGMDTCDFRIVRLSDPNLPANAIQTTDRSGHPLIAITDRMVRATANADELAFILAHEAAHHVAGHRDRALAAYGSRIAASLGMAPPDGLAEPATAHEIEFEADALGARIAAAAGYDPRRASELFTRLGVPEQGEGLSDHPSNAARRARLLD